VERESRLSRSRWRSGSLRRRRAFSGKPAGEDTRVRPLSLAPEEPKRASGGCSAREFHARRAGLGPSREGRTDAERALRQELEATLARARAPIGTGASLESLINALVVEEILL
jgi:hypothetical protein